VFGAEGFVAYAGDGHAVDVGEGRTGEYGAAAAGAIAHNYYGASHAISLAFIDVLKG
jgi:hypothetical protein